MKPSFLLILSVLTSALGAQASVKTTVAHNSNEKATADFKFPDVPSPSKIDAATTARFEIIDGVRDENCGDLDVLHDGKLPTEQDEPGANFFFNAGTEGGRLLVDLGKIVEVKQVNTYSWHPDTRGPQVYQLYISDGAASDFSPKPGHGRDPAALGWKLLAKIDTRVKDEESGGQYGVSISDTDGALGKFRYLLFAVSRTEADDAFGNTFLSEIDVIDQNANTDSAPVVVNEHARETIEMKGYTAALDTSETPDLTDWAYTNLVPMVREW